MSTNPEIWNDVSNVDFGATAEADFETACDDAMDNALPTTPTALSLGQLIKAQLAYLAPITTAANTTTFACTQLIGYGNDYFKGWYAYVVWDSGGATAAPQGEYQIITDYVSTTGTFTIAAYTAAHAVTDKVMIVHPSIAGLGLPTDAAASGAVTTTDTGIAYIKQLVTEGILRDAAIAAINTDLGNPSARTQLASLELMLGNPDVADNSIHDFLGDYTGPDDGVAADDNVKAHLDLVYARLGRVRLYKDIWCTAQLNNVDIHVAAGVIDLDFPQVVVAAQGAARGLPTGAVVTEAYLLMMFDLLDDSAAANWLDAAKDIRVMLTGQAWNNAPVAWTSVEGDWYTLGSCMSSQVIIGANNVVLATYGVTTTGVGTYEIGSDQSVNTTALTAEASHLKMKNLRTGLRLYYSL